MLNSDAGQKLRYLSLKECNSALTSAANIMPLKLDDGTVSGIWNQMWDLTFPRQCSTKKKKMENDNAMYMIPPT
jgi:hypothetical protein